MGSLVTLWCCRLLGSGAVAVCQLRQNGEYSYLWSLEDSRRSSVSCIKSFDLDKDGVNEVVVCRGDGRVEVFGSDAGGSIPSLRFTKSIGRDPRSRSYAL
jgi:hypothetical protein